MCRSRLYELHTQILDDTTARITELMAMERLQVWTQNSHYLSDSKACFLTMLQKQLHGGSINRDETCKDGRPVSYNIKAGLASLNAAGLGLTEDDLEELVARKRHKVMQEDEGLIELIAGALAYYKVGGFEWWRVHLPYFVTLAGLTHTCTVGNSPWPLGAPAS